MAYFNGMDGLVTWAAGYDTGVKQFEITAEADTAEYNNWSSATDYVEQLVGLKRWSGTLTADFDDSTGLPEPGTQGAASLRCAEVKQTWSGTIVLNRIRNMVQKSVDVIEVTLEFVGSGSLSLPDGT